MAAISKEMEAQILKRYNRQLILPEIGMAGQLKLQEAKVLVIGAGGLGCPILLYLAGAGVGKIGIVDDDLVSISNLHRQMLYTMADIGINKAELAAKKLSLLNPLIKSVPYAVRLTSENAAELIAPYDLVIDGSDNFSTRYLVNDTCVALNKVIVFGSIYQFEGQVSVFNFNEGPDYRSLYPEAPLPEDTGNCGEAGVIGTLPGIIGSIMANEAIKIICGFGEILAGQLFLFNALNNETQLFKFGKAPVKNGSKNKKATVFPVQEITLQKLREWEDQQIPHQLIDVREVYEYDEFNFGGINIPLYELNNQLSGLDNYEKIIFCCTTGKRSKIAIQLVKSTFKGEIFSLIIK